MSELRFDQQDLEDPAKLFIQGGVGVGQHPLQIGHPPPSLLGQEGQAVAVGLLQVTTDVLQPDQQSFAQLLAFLQAPALLGDPFVLGG